MFISCTIKRFIAYCLCLMLISLVLMPGPYTVVADGEVTIKIASFEGKAGEEITLPVSFVNVPENGISTINFELSYDSDILEVKSVIPGSIVNNPEGNYGGMAYPESGTIKLLFLDMAMNGKESIKSDGDFVNILLKIKDIAPIGTTSISVSDKGAFGDIKLSRINTYFVEGIINIASSSSFKPASTSSISKPTGSSSNQINYTNSAEMVISDASTEVPATAFEQLIKNIVLQIDNPYMHVNGSIYEIDPGRATKPVIVNGRTLLPIRAVIEYIGGSIGWDATEKKVTVSLDGKVVELWIGENVILADGYNIEIDVAPQIINERTYVPLRVVLENINCEVEWNGQERKITVKYVNTNAVMNQDNEIGRAHV